MFRFIILLKKTKAAGITIEPSAKAYFDIVGVIWSQEGYGYFDYATGQIACYVQEPPFTTGGGYFDR